jgi:hypothetical protein
MNPRKTCLTYLGWCPGIDSAASFLPNRDIPNRVVLIGVTGTMLLIICAFFVQVATRPSPSAPLIITIDGKTYEDSNFSTNFNYSILRDYPARFYIPLNQSEFAKNKMETENLNFQSMDDAATSLDTLNTPNIVKEFFLWLSNGTFEEAYFRFYHKDASTIPSQNTPMIQSNLGYIDRGCFYHVERIKTKMVPLQNNVQVSKMYNEGLTGRGPVWTFVVSLEKGPPYEATFTRFPYYTAKP